MIMTGAVALAMLMLAGCTGNTPVTKPTQDPPVTGEALLYGTWEFEYDYVSADGIHVTERNVLTFTAGGRWIQHVRRTGEGLRLNWSESGGWELFEEAGYIVRTRVAADGNTHSFDKQYSLLEDGNLRIQPWKDWYGDNDIWVYERVDDPPTPFYGTWRWEHRGLNAITEARAISVGADGSFMYEARFLTEEDPEGLLHPFRRNGQVGARPGVSVPDHSGDHPVLYC